MPLNESDRTVHAQMRGEQLARYDRTGKWYIESLDSKRRQVSIAGAVAAAESMVFNGGRVYLGQPGGTTFDRKYREATK